MKRSTLASISLPKKNVSNSNIANRNTGQRHTISAYTVHFSYEKSHYRIENASQQQTRDETNGKLKKKIMKNE